MNLLDKLAKLRDWLIGGKADATDVAQVDNWVSEAKRLFLLKSLKDHDGVKYVLEIFKSEVEKINQQLLNSNSKELPDRERDRQIDRRDLAQKYLNLFSGVKDDLTALEEKVKEENII